MTRVTDLQNITVGTYVEGIMTCSPDKFNEICLSFLHRLDDLQQIAGDLNKDDELKSFCDDYHQIESIHWQFKSGNLPTDAQRNSLRLIMKYAEKTASLLICPLDTNFFESASKYNSISMP